eukprot:1200922-Amphidinium_carterae.1
MVEQLSLQRALENFHNTEIQTAMDVNLDFFPTIHADTLKGIAKRMKNSSGGNDGIPTVVLKHLPDHIWRFVADQFSSFICYNVFLPLGKPSLLRLFPKRRTPTLQKITVLLQLRMPSEDYLTRTS